MGYSIFFPDKLKEFPWPPVDGVSSLFFLVPGAEPYQFLTQLNPFVPIKSWLLLLCTKDAKSRIVSYPLTEAALPWQL
jgi:hypothetical protein